MAKFTAIFRDIDDPEGRGEWEETHETDEVNSDEEAIEWCKKTIKWFNETIPKADGKPVEGYREFVRLKGQAETGLRKEHRWRKQNLHTISKGGRMYDIVRCDYCHITGKRYGIEAPTTRDYKYRHSDYDRCDTTVEREEKKREENVRL